jgi:uncharacterized protein (DUF305 family)
MTITAKIAIGIVLLAVLAGAGSAQQNNAATHQHSPSSTSNACYQRLADSMQHMHEAMAAVKPASPTSTDSDFVRLMLPHHEAAVEMAKVELECGNDPQMKRLAQEIITDQQSEIQLMQLWLRRHTGK